MKPESAQFLERASMFIHRAETMLTVDLNEDAARCAYFASFHTAQAYTFEQTGKVAKSHAGVQTEFFRLTKDDTRVDPALRRFLSKSYDFKSAADYMIGPSAVISAHEAKEAVATAKRFFAHFTSLMADKSSL